MRRAFDHLSEGRLAWAPMPAVYDRAVFEDRTYDFVAGAENFRDRMSEYFPAERAAIDGYLELLGPSGLQGRGAQLFFVEKSLPPGLAHWIGPLLRRRFLAYASRTTHEVLSSLSSDPRLIGVLTAQYGDYGLPPKRSSFAMHALVAGHYLGGAAYPVGGAGSIPAISRIA